MKTMNKVTFFLLSCIAFYNVPMSAKNGGAIAGGIIGGAVLGSAIAASAADRPAYYYDNYPYYNSYPYYSYSDYDYPAYYDSPRYYEGGYRRSKYYDTKRHNRELRRENERLRRDKK